MKKIESFLSKNKDKINALCCYSIFFFAILSIIPSLSSVASNTTIFATTSWLSLVYKIATFGLFVLIVFLTIIANKIEFDKKFLIILAIYFGLSIFPNLFLNQSIFIDPGDPEKIIEYNPSLIALIESSIFCVRLIVLSILYIQIMPKIGNKKILTGVLNCFLCFGLLMVAYIFTIEFEGVMSFFKSNDGINNSVTSFFTNKNTLGIMLSVCIAICLVLITYSYRKKFYLFLLLIFYLTSIVVLARTSLIASTAMIILYIFSSFIFQRKYKAMFIIMSSLILLVVGYIVLVFNVPSFRESSSFNNKIYIVVSQLFKDSKDVTGRKYIWQITFERLLDPIRLLFGYGDTISNEALRLFIAQDKNYFQATSSYHNGIVYNVASGGLIRTFLYFYLIYYLVFRKIDNNGRREFKTIIVAIFSCFFILQFFEELVLFETSIGSNLWTLVLVSPLYFEKFNKEHGIKFDMNDLTICVTTLNKNEDEIIALVKNNNLFGKVIVGCQGAKEERNSKYSDDNLDIDIYFQTTLGTSKNRNYLLDRVSTKYCIFLDDDISLIDGTLQTMTDEFNKYEHFDLLFFALKFKDNRKVVNFKDGIFYWFSARSFGINSIVFNYDFIKKNNLRFNENIGPGCEISSGEDGQFAMAVAKKSNNCYKSSRPLIEISYENGSTWFKGYDERYFVNIGYSYGMCYGIMAKPLSIYTLVKHRKEYLTNIPFKEAYSYVKKGLTKYKNDR